MGLSKNSTGLQLLSDNIEYDDNKYVIALAGNPNVGKSTVFNSLTGLKQHTGNWPGKTVTNARGQYKHKNKDFILVDLPGTYSMISSSVEEEIARDFMCFGNPDTTIVVADATCMERNLNLVLQTLEMQKNVIVCVNLIDEATRKGIKIDVNHLSKLLGVPVVATNARKKRALKPLMDEVYKVVSSKTQNTPYQVEYDIVIEKAISFIQPIVENIVKDSLDSRFICLKLLENDKTILSSINDYLGINLDDYEALNLSLSEARLYLINQGYSHDIILEKIVSNLIEISEDIYKQTVKIENKKYNENDRKIDRVLTSKVFGIPIMIALLGVVFWLTITGANYPSQMLARFFAWLQGHITSLFTSLNSPQWIHDILVLGVYRTLAWVISVMLPPMAIFFPLFTFLEDLGYLPRVAFNLDNYFKKSCAHGKQALCMCMGFGCNAAGVIGCRIIDSPRERLIAIITNNFVPCNGRFPTLIAISTIFIGGMVASAYQSLLSTITMVCVILLGVMMTLFISRLLSKTILKGLPSSFQLELPPYRKPQVGRIIVRSILDRTLFVLGRAIIVAAPAGLIIWIMANINAGDISLLQHCANFLDPFANLIGMDGIILMAFILGLPANEIVIPIIIMSYMATGSMLELDSLTELKTLLINNGWTWLTAVNVMLFSLMHFPCATTLLTIKKETQSVKWTLVSFLVPTITGLVICFAFTAIVRLLGLA